MGTWGPEAYQVLSGHYLAYQREAIYPLWPFRFIAPQAKYTPHGREDEDL